MLPSRYFKIEGTVRFKQKCAHQVEKKLFKSINQDGIRTESSDSQQSGLNQDFQEMLD